MILFLAETVETGDKNRDVTDNMFRAPCMFCEESLRKINVTDVFELFRNGSVHEFCRLKALITLEEVNTSMVEKRRIFMSKTSMSTCFNDVLVAVTVFVP